jgi:hypothetical protein
MWLLIAGIGLGSILGLALYDTLIKKARKRTGEAG